MEEIERIKVILIMIDNNIKELHQLMTELEILYKQYKDKDPE